MTRVLVTGSCGFVGYHLCNRLLKKGLQVIGIDSLSDYYSVELKESRLNILKKYENFEFFLADIENDSELNAIFDKKIDIVVHLAAQAGVRYSIEEPEKYLSTNIVGSFNLLKRSVDNEVEHFMFSSTSSAYGANTEMPFKELDNINTPLSFYAATKGAFELMLHSFSNIYDLPVTVFRFFTVYGPYGRPDMAMFKFSELINSNLPIDVYNGGDMWRDFTYIGDLVKSIDHLMHINPKSIQLTGTEFSKYKSAVAPYHVVNIGNSKPAKLANMINILEEKLNKKAVKNYLPLQLGDVVQTYADTKYLNYLTGYVPDTDLNEGISKFVNWYKLYKNI